MHRSVPGEPASGLLELTTACDVPLATGLVPGDRDMHEALEEVAFTVICDAPVLLELLVGGEVGASAEQLESRSYATSGSPSAVSVVVSWRADDPAGWGRPLLPGKLEGLLPGHRLVTSDSVHEPDLVIVDIARLSPREVVDTWPDIPILGFTNHTDRSGLQRAHTAGFDQVIVKSALVERAPELVDELTGVDRQ